jgi:hypothetical protein
MQVMGQEMDIYIKEIEVNMEIGMHDSITINAEFGIADPEVLSNQPFQIRYGQAPNSNVFYGYFDSIVKNQDLNSTIDITTQGLGWTTIMRRGARRILEGSTMAETLRPLIAPYGFRSTIDEPQFASYHEAQVDQSDFNMIVQVAGSLNRFVSAVNGSIWIFDPLAELKKGKPLYTFDRSGTDPNADSYLLDYQPSGNYRDMSNYENTIGYAYFNSNGSVVVKNPTDDAYTTNYYDGYLPNADWANRVAQIVKMQWFHTATARINGNAHLVPGTVCAFMTTRPEVRPMDKFDGLWMIKAVQHKLGMNFFQTSLSLIRDEVRMPILGSNYVWPITTRPGTLVPFIIVNNRWRL